MARTLVRVQDGRAGTLGLGHHIRAQVWDAEGRTLGWGMGAVAHTLGWGGAQAPRTPAWAVGVHRVWAWAGHRLGRPLQVGVGHRLVKAWEVHKLETAGHGRSHEAQVVMEAPQLEQAWQGMWPPSWSV